MTLLTSRILFAGLLPKLIDEAFRLGYDVTIGEVMRSIEQAKANAAAGVGIANSLHCVGLAVDLNLYQGGKYLLDGTGHQQLGPFWKGLNPNCRWGGDFKARDWNHYSIAFQGRA